MRNFWRTCLCLFCNENCFNLCNKRRLGPRLTRAKSMRHLTAVNNNSLGVFGQLLGLLTLSDAAHAMVPFYGQGMNCGFEDCTLLDQLLTEFDGNFKNVLENFTERRMHDAHAICDLAMYNFEEMKNLVTTKTYQLRKLLDNMLFQLFPQYWIPLYNSVSFSEIRYTQCMKNRQWQNWVLMITFGGLFLCGLLLVFFTWIKS